MEHQLYEAVNHDEGVSAGVWWSVSGPYRVVYTDLDANENIPVVSRFKSLDEAVRGAQAFCQ